MATARTNAWHNSPKCRAPFGGVGRARMVVAEAASFTRIESPLVTSRRRRGEGREA